MDKNRLEAFSDGVIAIIITIMVLELKVPAGEHLSELASMWHVLLGYVLSFTYVGIYWNNHHHLLKTTSRVNGSIMWANLHLLFWMSLIPFATEWTGEHFGAPGPQALYGAVLLMTSIAWGILQRAIIAEQGRESQLREVVGRDLKGLLPIAMYLAAIGLAYVKPWIASVLYAVVAVMWFVPDKRFEKAIPDES